VAGTLPTVALSEARVTEAPPAGAGVPICTKPLAGLPPVTVFGKPKMVTWFAALIVSVAEVVLPFSAPEIRAVVSLPTPFVVMLN